MLHTYSMLYGWTYIYVGGVNVSMFTIQTSRDWLQNNTMIIIYQNHNTETTSLNILATILNTNNLTHKL